MDIVIILLLIVLNGVLALSEIAIVSARKARLQQWADEGRSRAETALALANEPGPFLSTIQVGITSIGILSGAIGEAAIAQDLAPQLAELPGVGRFAGPIAIAIVVIVITYLSVIIGELVPKRLALLNPEAVALLVARPMQFLSTISAPIVRFFDWSSEVVLRLVGAREGGEPPVTGEEIEVLMEQGAEAGVFEKGEQKLVSRILRLDEQRVVGIMTPRVDIYLIDLEDPFEENKRKLIESPHSRVPVCKGGLDNILGIAYARDLVSRLLAGQPLDLPSMVRPPVYVPGSLSPIELLESFKRLRSHIAFIVDEYGEVEGLVTMNDVLEAIVGDVATSESAGESLAVRREDGSWLVDGMLPIDRLKEILEVEELPDEESGNYHTVGGLVMMQLGRVPRVADHFDLEGLRFEVVDMDRNRVDKMLVSRRPDPAPPAVQPPST
jgi:putative hemolysin